MGASDPFAALFCDPEELVFLSQLICPQKKVSNNFLVISSLPHHFGVLEALSHSPFP